MSRIVYEIPDGEYLVDIIEIENIIDSKERQVVVWLMKMLDGPHAGNLIQKKFYVAHLKAQELLEKELQMIGIHAKNSEELETKKNMAHGIRIRLNSVTNDQGSRSHFVKECLGKIDVPQAMKDEKVKARW